MSKALSARSYGFEVVVTAKLVVEASDGREARALVEGMLDGASAKLTSGVGFDLGLDDIRVVPAKITLATIDGADPTMALRVVLETSRGWGGPVVVR